MDRINWIKSGDLRILHLDLSNLSPDQHDQVVDVLGRARQVIDQQPPQSVLLLTDLANSSYDASFIELAKQFMAANKKNVRASAIVRAPRLVGATVAVLNLFTSRSVKAFDELDSAQAWLRGL